MARSLSIEEQIQLALAPLVARVVALEGGGTIAPPTPELDAQARVLTWPGGNDLDWEIEEVPA